MSKYRKHAESQQHHTDPDAPRSEQDPTNPNNPRNKKPSPARKDGKKGDLLSRGAKFLKQNKGKLLSVVNPVAPVVSDVVKKAAKLIKKKASPAKEIKFKVDLSKKQKN